MKADVPRWPAGSTRGARPGIPRDLVFQQLTHEALDGLLAGSHRRICAAWLVAVKTLPPRDERMARFVPVSPPRSPGRAAPDEQQLLHCRAIWRWAWLGEVAALEESLKHLGCGAPMPSSDSARTSR